MIVPLTLADFLERAEHVYGDREAIVDEPNPPGGGLGRITYGQFAAMSRSLAAALDDLGVADGERVAIISPNAARFLVSLFGVSVYGRVIVPVNFRLNAEEVRYIVEHSGSTVALIDPELDEPLRSITVKHRLVLGASTDARLFGRRDARPGGSVTDENATVSINYTSGTTARPKGVQLTHRGCWLNAVTFGWHLGLSDRDVYLHTLPTFHCNGWGMPYAVTAIGARQVIIRKIDGEEILKRVQREGVTIFNCAPAVIAAVLDAAAARRRRRRRSSVSRPSSAGSSSRSTGSPRPRPCSPSIARPRSGTAWTGRSGPGASRVRACRRSASAWPSTPTARFSPAPITSSRATGTSRRRPPGPSSTAGSTPATAATPRTPTP
jgi:acyl-CoA synthetase (AMP-forming)/AMP-acid ligase II